MCAHRKLSFQSLPTLPSWIFLLIVFLLGGSYGKESPCSVRDLGLIPGLGRSPGGGHRNPLQYSCLENPHRQKTLADYSPWGRKELDITERLSTHSTLNRKCSFAFFSTSVAYFWLSAGSNKNYKSIDKFRLNFNQSLNMWIVVFLICIYVCV